MGSFHISLLRSEEPWELFAINIRLLRSYSRLRPLLVISCNLANCDLSNTLTEHRLLLASLPAGYMIAPC
jgi:hypothetical protein